MIELLEFVFQSFWHFIGCLMLLMVAVSPLHGLAALLSVMRK